MPQFPDFDSLDTDVQERTIGWDFTQYLAPGSFLTNNTIPALGIPGPSVIISCIYGNDLAATSRILTPPFIGQGASGAPNCAIITKIGLLLAVKYLFTLACVDSTGDVATGFNHIIGIDPF